MQVGDEARGGLTESAASELGLPAGCPVFVGGGDAFVGLLGMGVCSDGEFGLMTGSSNVLSGFASADVRASGLFGSFPNAVVPGLGLLEAGQPSTGSMIRWFQREFAAGRSLEDLDKDAESVQVGSGGVVVFDSWQGNRTPHTDSHARGVIWGMSLGTSRAHVYRAMLEGVAFGTRAMVEAMRCATG
jgi:ribulose kinase